MVYTKLDAEFLFKDGETKTFSFEPFRPTSTAVQGFKARAKAINAEPSDIAQEGVVVSKNGAEFQAIKSATTTSYEQTVLYAKNEIARQAALKFGGIENGD